MASEIRGSDNFDSSSVGKVLQVVTATTTSSQILATSTYTDIVSLSATITPSSATSKILAQWVVDVRHGVGAGLGSQLVRNSTNVFTSHTNHCIYSNVGTVNFNRGNFLYLDSPNSTSAITYKVQASSYTGISITLNEAGQAQLLLMEIGV